MKEVVAGIKWLDENHPDWLKKIKITKLKMKLYDYCILGQIDKESLCIKSKSWLMHHGFWHKSTGGYKPLQKAWLEEIRKRRKK